MKAQVCFGEGAGIMLGFFHGSEGLLQFLYLCATGPLDRQGHISFFGDLPVLEDVENVQLRQR